MSKRIAHRDVFLFFLSGAWVFYFFGSVVSPSLMLIVIIDDDDDFIVEYGLSFLLWCLTEFERLAR